MSIPVNLRDFTKCKTFDEETPSDAPNSQNVPSPSLRPIFNSYPVISIMRWSESLAPSAIRSGTFTTLTTRPSASSSSTQSR